ncbi:unnamed protein product [Owenia fusiformis]|uniref:Uncharacterized protein n=1 Tax=Owenia fusiformis TaxID=6347 RepID=A0A8S4NSN9_OWEFU|nr:unnamed protein product [Owenia fusiformis]
MDKVFYMTDVHANLEYSDICRLIPFNFTTQDATRVLHNKFIIIIGDSIQRMVYKDLVFLCQNNHFTPESRITKKGELSFENDELIEGGKLGLMVNEPTYREVRQYTAQNLIIRFYFITRAYSAYMETILEDLASGPQPDLILINSCLWDMTRYGVGYMEGYRTNLTALMEGLNRALQRNTLVIWATALPVSESCRGGVITPELEHRSKSLNNDVSQANLWAQKIVSHYNCRILDLNFFFRKQGFRRRGDGTHWDRVSHRHITNLLLHTVAELWVFMGRPVGYNSPHLKNGPFIRSPVKDLARLAGYHSGNIHIFDSQLREKQKQEAGLSSDSTCKPTTKPTGKLMTQTNPTTKPTGKLVTQTNPTTKPTGKLMTQTNPTTKPTGKLMTQTNPTTKPTGKLVTQTNPTAKPTGKLVTHTNPTTKSPKTVTEQNDALRKDVDRRFLIIVDKNIKEAYRTNNKAKVELLENLKLKYGQLVETGKTPSWKNPKSFRKSSVKLLTCLSPPGCCSLLRENLSDSDKASAQSIIKNIQENDKISKSLVQTVIRGKQADSIEDGSPEEHDNAIPWDIKDVIEESEFLDQVDEYLYKARENNESPKVELLEMMKIKYNLLSSWAPNRVTKFRKESKELMQLFSPPGSSHLHDPNLNHSTVQRFNSIMENILSPISAMGLPMSLDEALDQHMAVAHANNEIAKEELIDMLRLKQAYLGAESNKAALEEFQLSAIELLGYLSPPGADFFFPIDLPTSVKQMLHETMASLMDTLKPILAKQKAKTAIRVASVEKQHSKDGNNNRQVKSTKGHPSIGALNGSNERSQVGPQITTEGQAGLQESLGHTEGEYPSELKTRPTPQPHMILENTRHQRTTDTPTVQQNKDRKDILASSPQLGVPYGPSLPCMSPERNQPDSNNKEKWSPVLYETRKQLHTMEVPANFSFGHQATPLTSSVRARRKSDEVDILENPFPSSAEISNDNKSQKSFVFNSTRGVMRREFQVVQMKDTPTTCTSAQISNLQKNQQSYISSNICEIPLKSQVTTGEVNTGVNQGESPDVKSGKAPTPNHEIFKPNKSQTCCVSTTKNETSWNPSSVEVTPRKNQHVTIQGSSTPRFKTFQRSQPSSDSISKSEKHLRFPITWIKSPDAVFKPNKAMSNMSKALISPSDQIDVADENFGHPNSSITKYVIPCASISNKNGKMIACSLIGRYLKHLGKEYEQPCHERPKQEKTNGLLGRYIQRIIEAREHKQLSPDEIYPDIMKENNSNVMEMTSPNGVSELQSNRNNLNSESNTPKEDNKISLNIPIMLSSKDSDSFDEPQDRCEEIPLRSKDDMESMNPPSNEPLSAVGSLNHEVKPLPAESPSLYVATGDETSLNEEFSEISLNEAFLTMDVSSPTDIPKCSGVFFSSGVSNSAAVSKPDKTTGWSNPTAVSVINNEPITRHRHNSRSILRHPNSPSPSKRVSFDSKLHIRILPEVPPRPTSLRRPNIPMQALQL